MYYNTYIHIHYKEGMQQNITQELDKMVMGNMALLIKILLIIVS